MVYGLMLPQLLLLFLKFDRPTDYMGKENQGMSAVAFVSFSFIISYIATLKDKISKNI